MSKRREQYENGLERLFGFLAILSNEKELPTIKEIRAEIDAIRSLRPFKINISIPPHLSDTENGFFFLVNETYERYDDNFPQELDILLLPASLHNRKELDKFITTQ
ncbi:MAG: hypothetical protein C4527_09795 [Candidatus Omnitrophota bacterium]|jgi:hypothetical protein|nr:MAG: hypothetical protein C4527_09795 [Candidatus Omnitrophota bacterium]